MQCPPPLESANYEYTGYLILLFICKTMAIWLSFYCSIDTKFTYFYIIPVFLVERIHSWLIGQWVSHCVKLDLPIVSEQNFCSETICFICSLTILFLRERERKRVSLIRNNFSLNWFNLNFCSETIELCCQLF